MLARFSSVLLRCLVLVLGLAVLLEVGLRALGIKPQDLASAGLAATIDDPWTAWAMRPGVRQNEFVVTNAQGMHEDREVTLEKPSGVARIAVLGDSVVWGIGQYLKDTIPRIAQEELRAAKCEAQVLNFSGIGFNILNASAHGITRVQQFNPDAIVVVMDLQMAFPQWPDLSLRKKRKPPAVRQLGDLESAFKRATEYSALLTVLDEPSILKATLSARLPLPLEPKPPRAGGARAPAPGPPGMLKDAADWAAARGLAALEALKSRPKLQEPFNVAAAAPAALSDAERIPSVSEHEARRRRELGGVLASLAAFSREMGIPLYFVTPYGPYREVPPEQLAKFSLSMLRQSASVYGDLGAALAKEMELTGAVIGDTAARHGAKVIDLLPAARAKSAGDADFAGDGIHLTPQGYRTVGTAVAKRLLADGRCRATASAAR